FKKEYDLLRNLPEEARGETPEKAIKINQNSLWWGVLEEARTIFEKNPD
ncbi:MAG: hypothetical protein UT60_C0053G0001, partial [candidate division CPR2 bacterium GW2011_GWD2_39_7]